MLAKAERLDVKCRASGSKIKYLIFSKMDIL
jgi:hypothetical protein